MANNSGNMHEEFEDFTFQKVKTGWLVTVKGDHELKGAWHFKDRDEAVDFVNDGKVPGTRGRHSVVSNIIVYIFTAAALFLLYLILFA